ncbi:MAG TPA: autotransporter outer membrane beta-barrel domain-containing protein [Sedimentisphaerales bacterium]|nr:autotransporter outer membrane beta-barrel domain-containing protein [Sedimentisphaerales bacterium]
MPESGNFGFSITPTNPSISFNLNTQNNNPQASAEFTVPAGIAYTITETSLPSNDWTLENVSCSIDDGPPFEPQISNNGVTLPELNPDDDVQCTFRNRLDEEADTGTIQVLKQTVDAQGTNVPESGNFGFAITPTNPSVSFNLNTSTNNPQASSQFTVPSGVDYTITETSMPSNDWALETVFCSTNGGDPVELPITGTSVTLPELEVEENVQCTFTNRLRPDEGTLIKIIKRLDPGSDEPTEAAQFNFNVDGQPAATLGIDEEINIPVEPGERTVEELTPPANWELMDIDCGDDQNPATVTVEQGETVTCTFTNKFQGPTGSLKVKKVTIGGDDSFKFSVSGQSSFSLRNGKHKKFNSLPVGKYTIREVDLPKGWTLRDVSCNERGDKSRKGITVSLDEGDDIVCTFRNFKEEDERMEDLTKLFIHRRVDNLLTYGPGRGRILRRLQEQPIVPLKGGPLKYSEESGSAAQGHDEAQTPYALGYSAVQAPQQTLGQSAAQVPQALGHNPLQTPHAQSGGRYNNGAYGQANSLMPGGGSDFARDDALGLAGQQKSSGILPSLGAQLVPLASGGGQTFKFGTSLSEMRAAAAQAEAQSQQQKLNAAGLSFSDQPYLNPYQEIRPGFDVWVEGQFINYDDDTGGINRDGDFSVLYFGADYALAPGVLIGAIFQLDWTDEEINDPTVRGEIDGTGWLAGPYIGLRLTDFLFFDARAAWGTSDNDIWITDAAAGKRSGDFDTDRWLASASLTGTHTFGAWRLSPQIGIDYGSESFDTYRNSLSQIVRGSDAEIGRFRGGAELGYRMQTSGGTIVEPTVSLEGLWNFEDDEFSVDGVPVDFDQGRAKLEGGVIVTTPSGWSFRGAGIYDGIGANDFDAYGGQFWVNVPLQGRQ